MAADDQRTIKVFLLDDHEVVRQVVGSRSRSRLAGMVLGSVALDSVVHSAVPVMVVHPPSARREPAAASAADGG
jgi:hypothetical protein